jgi:hypothetical protein
MMSLFSAYSAKAFSRPFSSEPVNRLIHPSLTDLAERRD